MNRIGKRIFVFLTAVLLLMSLVSLPVLAADTADVERIYGENRCLTAIEVSQFAYPDGADTVIIVTANNFPDALAGSVLAHHLGAPILLVRDNDSDMTAVLAEMERLGVETAYILGGDKAVSDALEAKIETKASVERLAGESRYETAQLIADMVGMPEDGHVFLVSGTNFPDALAIAPVAARRGIPILLTDPDYLRDDVLTAFDELDVKSVTIIGGPKAIPEELAALLEEKGLEIEERIYGDSREDTAVAIAIAFFTEPGSVIVANGREGYPDALVGGYLGALLNAPLLLVKKDEVKDSTTTYLEDNNIGDVKVLGGDKVISDEVEEALGEIEGGEETPGGGGPVVPTDPDAADKSAAKAVIKPSWAVKNVEKVDELPFDTTETDSSLFEVTITTSYADIKAASESGRSVTTFFTVPEGVTVWYPVWDGSTQTYESTADETGPFAMGMVGHPLSAGNIEADGAVFVTLGETSETEFAFTIKLVDAAPGWGNVVYGKGTFTISTEIPDALAAINDMTGVIKGIVTREIEPLKQNASVLGLDLEDFNTIFAGDESSQEGGRQAAVIRDLVANKPEGGYDLLSLKNTFDSIVMVRLANQGVMDSANEDEATIEVLIGYVTQLKDAFTNATHTYHGMTGTKTEDKATDMVTLLSDFEALTPEEQATVFNALLEDDVTEGRRFKRATDVIGGLRKAIDGLEGSES